MFHANFFRKCLRQSFKDVFPDVGPRLLVSIEGCRALEHYNIRLLSTLHVPNVNRRFTGLIILFIWVLSQSAIAHSLSGMQSPVGLPSFESMAIHSDDCSRCSRLLHTARTFTISLRDLLSRACTPMPACLLQTWFPLWKMERAREWRTKRGRERRRRSTL